MNSAQRAHVIARFAEIINNDRIALLEEVLAQRTRYLTVILDDIFHSQNASAIIRTSECIGIHDLHIIEDLNEHKTNRDVVKGSAKWVNLQRYEKEEGRSKCIDKLKQQNYKLIAMTLCESAIALEELPTDEKMALCFGCEETGISQSIEDKADYKVKIPITGFTQSYNVSVSAAISLYYLTNKIKETKQTWQLEQEEKEVLLIEWLSQSTPSGKSLLEKYKNESR